ncbi:MAG TPA: PrgI family protein [Candidatus Paceibacterota bacterium]
MRFQVPQFIDIEDKVFGPFSFRQFVYIAGGIGIGFVLFRILPRFFAILAVIPVAIFSSALAFNFYKPTGQSFIVLLESFFKYSFGARLYIWKRKEPEAPTAKSYLPQSYRHLEMPALGKSRLKDMTWSLDARKESGGE